MGYFKERARDICSCGDEPASWWRTGFPRTSGHADQWPQQQRDARHERADAARQDEKKKVFHAATPLLERRRLSLKSVPAIRVRGAGLS